MFGASTWLLAFVTVELAVSVTGASTVDDSRFATAAEIRHLADKVCGQGLIGNTGLRLPGSEEHKKVVDFIDYQLQGIPGLEISRADFELANWSPAGNSMYQAARLEVAGEKVDVVSAIAYSLPTNGSYVSGELLYLNSTANISTIDLKGKIVIRDYALLPIPTSYIAALAYYSSPDASDEATYTRPYVTPPNADMLACSLGGAAGYISAFNVSRTQLEGYYSGHAGVHWLVPGVFTGAEQYQTIISAASKRESASIRIDAITNTVQVPRLFATLPGATNETIVVATHTDGDTYVQENGPVALLTLARYFAAVDKCDRNKTIKFVFEASHLAYQLDSDKIQAKELDAHLDLANDTTAFVIAIEHLGTRQIEQTASNTSYGNTLRFTGRGEAILWSVGPVQPAIDFVVNITKARNLDGTVVAPGFPPANPSAVPTYSNFGGLGTYYHGALVPTMAVISGPWSLWAPSFGADALNYTRLREQHMAIGDAILELSKYSKEELRGNYTMYRKQRAMGVETTNINYESAQFITDANATYY